MLSRNKAQYDRAIALLGDCDDESECQYCAEVMTGKTHIQIGFVDEMTRDLK